MSLWRRATLISVPRMWESGSRAFTVLSDCLPVVVARILPMVVDECCVVVHGSGRLSNLKLVDERSVLGGMALT